jgi:hypothetical protein
MDDEGIDYREILRGSDDIIYIELEVDDLDETFPPHVGSIAGFHRGLVQNGESGNGVVVLAYADDCFGTYAIEQDWTVAVNQDEITDSEYLTLIIDTYERDCY